MAHFALSYVLRYAGVLDESARECDAALALDPGAYQLRSCSFVFELLGNYDRAMDFLQLDMGSEWVGANLTPHFLRQGKVRRRARMPGNLPPTIRIMCRGVHKSVLGRGPSGGNGQGYARLCTVRARGPGFGEPLLVWIDCGLLRTKRTCDPTHQEVDRKTLLQLYATPDGPTSGVTPRNARISRIAGRGENVPGRLPRGTRTSKTLNQPRVWLGLDSRWFLRVQMRSVRAIRWRHRGRLRVAA